MGRRIGLIAVTALLVTFGIYFLSAVRKDRLASPTNAQFNLLADSFLHGRLFLVNPPSTYDLTLFNGNWFVPFPPLPALLMLPFVAAFGVERLNTVMFSALIGAINVATVFLILHAMTAREWTNLNVADSLWLTVLFGIGSIHWYSATLGTVWFVSQMCTVLFIALAIWTAIVFDSPILSGTLFGAAMLARPHVALTYPLLVAIAVKKTAHDESRWKKIRRCAIAMALPIFGAAIALLAYNWARFENPFDFGYQTQNVYPEMTQDLQTYGQFNLYYVPRNLWTMFLALPQWNDATKSIVPLDAGMSIFITTPALFYLLRACQKSPLVIGAWISIALLLVPLLTYYNTGAAQFGYRFSLDFMVPALILLGVAAKDGVSWLMRVLILAGVAVNAWGVTWFGSV